MSDKQKVWYYNKLGYPNNLFGDSKKKKKSCGFPAALIFKLFQFDFTLLAIAKKTIVKIETLVFLNELTFYLFLRKLNTWTENILLNELNLVRWNKGWNLFQETGA